MSILLARDSLSLDPHKTLLDIRNYIIKTITKKYYYLFETKTEIYDILVALKTRLILIDETRKIQVAWD
jgi:hypothetical protein